MITYQCSLTPSSRLARNPLFAVTVWTGTPSDRSIRPLALPTTSAFFPSTHWRSGCFEHLPTSDTTAPLITVSVLPVADPRHFPDNLRVPRDVSPIRNMAPARVAATQPVRPLFPTPQVGPQRYTPRRWPG